MKNTGRTILCLLVALALVLGGISWGARKGWQAEAAQLQAQYMAEGGLKNMLELRAADASNLLKVAGRYMGTQDAPYAAVASARDTLKSESASLPEKCKANQSLTQGVNDLAQALSPIPAFQASVRDQNYLTSLREALLSYNETAVAQSYNEAAADYNQRKRESPSGLAAGFLGIEDAPLFAAP
jgi:hypothetical protein